MPARGKVGEYLALALCPAATAPRDTRQMAPGATTCINESGSGSDEDKKMDCPQGTKYVTGDEDGSGCRPECRPGSYSSTGLYPCTRCEEGTYTKESGATACTDYPKECSEGYKLTTTEGTMTECKRECAKGYYSKTGVYPCKACERGYTTMERGATECMKSDDKNKNSDDNNTDDKKECPEGTEWIEDDKAKGCRPLCKLGWYNKDTGAWPCTQVPQWNYNEDSWLV